MRRAVSCLLVLAALAAGCVTTGRATQSAVIRAKNKVAPALVHIRPVKKVFTRGKREEVLAVGSGFIISSDGYVVTNEHVVGKASFVRCVLSNKEEVEAQVVGVDPYTDVAVLKLDAEDPLPHVRLGRSGALEAGQTVLALGSPHGLARSVSLGIVSVTDRYLEERGKMVSPFNNFIQTDAAINQGNSGGPLVNIRGEVVGINARMLRGAENVGFAIPIDTARPVIEQLIANGRVTRSWLGLNLQEMTRKTDDPAVKGVVIGDVHPLGPCIDAGVRPGDVLLAVDGTPTNARFKEDLPAVRKCIADIPVGAEVVLRVARGDNEIDFPVVTDEKSELKGDEVEFEEWGFTASELTPAMVRRAGLSERQGIAVSGTQAGGFASNAGLQRGDIVLEVDETGVENLAHFRRIYGELVESGQRLVMAVVKRGALTRFVLIKQDANATVAAEGEQAPKAEGGNADVE